MATTTEARYDAQYALFRTGGAKCRGRGDYGQIGNGANVNQSTPVDASGLTSGAKSVACGQFSTCAMTTGNVAKCWGDNAYGQLGDGAVTARNSPVNVTGLPAITVLKSGAWHACAGTASGGLYCWGYNADGTLGNGTTTQSSVPVQVSP